MKDPREVVKAGDIVQVKVMEVDVPRKRIGLSMRLSDEPGEKAGNNSRSKNRPEGRKSENSTKQSQKGNKYHEKNRQPKGSTKTGTLGDLFAQALKNK